MPASEGLGSTLTHADQSAFFRWFCLTSLGDCGRAMPDTRPGGIERWPRFRPEGPRFRDLVELQLGVGANGVIALAALGIDRAFIAAPRIRPFARDVVASFLRWALHDPGRFALEADIERIGRFCDGESALLPRRDSLMASWLQAWRDYYAEPSTAVVFMGRRLRARRRVGGVWVLAENLAGALPQGVADVPASTRRGRLQTTAPAWLRIVVSRDRSR